MRPAACGRPDGPSGDLRLRHHDALPADRRTDTQQSCVTGTTPRDPAPPTNFFDTEEIVVVNHTDCGMMSASDEAIREGLAAQTDGVDDPALDPSLPELSLGDADLLDWVDTTDDIDEACARQVALLEQSAYIPDDVTISGYVYEVESGELRHPGERVAEAISERRV